MEGRERDRRRSLRDDYDKTIGLSSYEHSCVHKKVFDRRRRRPGKENSNLSLRLPATQTVRRGKKKTSGWDFSHCCISYCTISSQSPCILEKNEVSSQCFYSGNILWLIERETPRKKDEERIAFKKSNLSNLLLTTHTVHMHCKTEIASEVCIFYLLSSGRKEGSCYKSPFCSTKGLSQCT